MIENQLRPGGEESRLGKAVYYRLRSLLDMNLNDNIYIFLTKEFSLASAITCDP